MIILNSTRPTCSVVMSSFIPLIMQASNNRTVHQWKRSRTWLSLWPVENLAALGPCRWPAQVTEFARISVKQWNPDQQKQVRLEATQYDTRSHKIIQHACCRFYINICMTLYDIVWLYDIIVIESIEGSGYMELPALDPQELAADVAKVLRMSFGFSFPRDVFFFQTIRIRIHYVSLKSLELKESSRRMWMEPLTYTEKAQGHSWSVA